MSGGFVTRLISAAPDAMAPDGSEVRILAVGSRGSMAEFTLPAGKISAAVSHVSVEEVWFFTEGRGRLWRKNKLAEETVDVFPGVSILIPPATHFQFRNDSSRPLRAIGVTMPPWPGPAEASPVPGIWPPSR